MFSKMVEALAWSAGLVCVAFVGVRHLDSVNNNRESMRKFTALTTAEHRRGRAVDVTLWSDARIKAWQRAQDRTSPTPLAVLRIPRIRLEVPVLEGTDELTLNRAVGHIEDTAMPGVDGNAGIAGHRDGFFRGLMDVVPGDAIELESLHGTEYYRIERTWIVTPDDVSVLAPTPGRSLTIVTCYPFYFVGPAPERYIVRAVRATDTRQDRRAVHRLFSPPAITENE